MLGDIHGRTVWKEILNKESPDFVIFLGDYVSSHDSISAEQQISNLEEILLYKESNQDKVILLRGNHCIQHLGYYWAECSGWNSKVQSIMSQPEFKERFLNLTRWIYISDELKTIFSHAGISQVWMDNIAHIQSIYEINNLEPSEIFGFTPDNPWDRYGDSKTQPLTWIRPQALCKCNIEGWDQVVGHTPVKNITNAKQSAKYNQNIWLCDALGVGQYLVIDNDFIINNI